MAKKILVADDDQTLRNVYETTLKQQGFDVSSAADGQSALNKIVSENPDLVILDLAMPRIDGFNILEIIKKSPAQKDTIFLVVSARGDEESRKNAIDLGADEYLVKSEMNMTILVEKINELLK